MPLTVDLSSHGWYIVFGVAVVCPHAGSHAYVDACLRERSFNRPQKRAFDIPYLSLLKQMAGTYNREEKNVITPKQKSP